MNSVAIKDKELIHSYLKGEISSLNTLINKHKHRVFTSIYLLVKDKFVADDLFQETFIKVIDSLDSGKYKEEGKFLPWVLRVAHNITIDYFRKTKRNPSFINSEDNNIMSSIKDEDVEHFQSTNSLEVSIKALIQHLPAEQREVLVMRLYAELSFKEISEITKVSINTALGRMRYALINLRRMIEERNSIVGIDYNQLKQF
ncbi:MAG: sigma-70 family RNA polymerase sigma factor [Chitinophagales bacterium]|nr:sigma-70 family RNA polymerase sigma factor [Chitinophagales bacterium]